MPKRSSKPKLDANQAAFATIGHIDRLLDTDDLRRQIMREMGSRGGKVGGKRRLQTMTATERSEAAKTAANARWAKKKA